MMKMLTAWWIRDSWSKCFDIIAGGFIGFAVAPVLYCMWAATYQENANRRKFEVGVASELGKTCRSSHDCTSELCESLSGNETDKLEDGKCGYAPYGGYSAPR